MLVSLAIAAALLTATAAAINASLRAYRVNQEHAQVSQSARLAMNRVTASVRTSTNHSTDGSFASGLPANGSSISMIDDSGQPLSFRHDAGRKQLLLTRAGRSHALCRNVEHFSVTLTPARSEASARVGGPHDVLACASVQLTVRAGRQSVTLSGSAAPRRNAW